MCVIIAAHASSNLRADVSSWCTLVLGILFAAGTPGFSLLSGTLFGYFVASRPNPSKVAKKYQQRALALLVFAHPVITIALYGPIGRDTSFIQFLLGRWYITDTLALIFLATPLLAHFRPWHCLVAGMALPLVGRIILVTAPTDNLTTCAAVNALAGVDRIRPSVLIDCYGLLAILAYFLLGMFVGHRFASSALSGRVKGFANTIFKYAFPVGACSLPLIGTYAGAAFFASDSTRSTLKWFFYPTRDFSMLPAYLAMFLVVFAMLLRRYGTIQRINMIDHALARLGKHSLLIYCAQYFVVQTLPHLANWKGRMTAWHLFVFIIFAYFLLITLAGIYGALSPVNKRVSAARHAHEHAGTFGAEQLGFPSGHPYEI